MSILELSDSKINQIALESYLSHDLSLKPNGVELPLSPTDFMKEGCRNTQNLGLSERKKGRIEAAQH